MLNDHGVRATVHHFSTCPYKCMMSDLLCMFNGIETEFFSNKCRKIDYILSLKHEIEDEG